MKSLGHLLKAAGSLVLAIWAVCSCGTARVQIREVPAAPDFSGIDSTLDLYLASLDGEPPKIQKENIDFIINECGNDTATARHAALRMYDHYRNSPLMGAETMAIHLIDTWFSAGRMKMRSDEELLAARMFAEFNRNSLIGARAPECIFKTPDGKDFNIPEDCLGEYTVLYFYDAGCPVCTIESARLKADAEAGNQPVRLNLVMVYTGQDRDIWENYCSSRLPGTTDSLNTTNLWSPGYESDFPRLYGVISTPKLFLLDKQGTIIGRNLDTESLKELLAKTVSPPQITPEEMKMLVDIVLPTIGARNCENVKALVDIFRKQLEDSSMAERAAFLGALYYDLRYRPEYPYKCGAAYLAEKEILPSGENWDGAILADALLFMELYNMTPLGEKVQDFPLPGMKKTLYGVKAPLTVVFIYSPGCTRCESEMPAIKALEDKYRNRAEFIYINSDEYDTESFLAGYFDLSLLPAIFLLGEDKDLYAKYIDAEELGELLEIILSSR